MADAPSTAALAAEWKCINRHTYVSVCNFSVVQAETHLQPVLTGNYRGGLIVGASCLIPAKAAHTFGPQLEFISVTAVGQ
jgi:hypothetical protein